MGDLIALGIGRPVPEKTTKPWHHVGHRIMGCPFTPIGIAYCPRCTEYESTATEYAYEGRTYAAREWCRKCGKIVRYAVWGGDGDEAKARRAYAWATEEGPDRTGGLVVNVSGRAVGPSREG